MTIVSIVCTILTFALLVLATVLFVIGTKRDTEAMEELVKENQRQTAKHKERIKYFSAQCENLMDMQAAHFKNSIALRDDIINLQKERIAQLERINNLLMNEISSKENKEATH